MACLSASHVPWRNSGRIGSKRLFAAALGDRTRNMPRPTSIRYGAARGPRSAVRQSPPRFEVDPRIDCLVLKRVREAAGRPRSSPLAGQAVWLVVKRHAQLAGLKADFGAH